MNRTGGEQKRLDDGLRRKGPPRDLRLWWSKRKYYTVEALVFAYSLFWLWAWYGLVYRDVLPVWARILIAVFLVFTKMEAPFFQKYENAMNRYRKAEGLPDEYYEEFPWFRPEKDEDEEAKEWSEEDPGGGNSAWRGGKG